MAIKLYRLKETENYIIIRRLNFYFFENHYLRAVLGLF